MRVLRLRATNTHLYPGARLALAEPGDAPRKSDRAVIEFADGEAAQATVIAATPDARIELAVEGHRTGRGTTIAAKRWLAERIDGSDGHYRVIRRSDVPR